MTRTPLAILSLLSLTFGLFPIPTFAAVSTDTLVAYWKFDETSGTSAADSSGGGINGTHQNSPTISTDVPTVNFTNARSLSFDGTNDYVSLPSTSSTNLTGVVTVAAWIKLSATGLDQKIIGNQNEVSGGYKLSVFTNNKVEFEVRDASNASAVNRLVSGGTTLTTGVWYHVAGVYDDSANFLATYVNGVLDRSMSTSLVLSTSGDAQIGKEPYTTAGYFSGNIDDLRLYRRVLSGREIAELGTGNHTTQYWKGTTNTSFESPSNWSGSFLPDPYTRVTIQATNNQPVMTGAVQTARLIINSGALLKTGGQNLTWNDSGTFTNYGTLAVRGNETLTNFTNDTSKGTVLVYGTGSSTGLSTGSSYNHLTINDGLVTYLKFNETTGTRVADSSGWGMSGSLVNGAAASTNLPSLNFHNPRSVSFDGTNDHVDLPDGYADFRDGMTVALWARPTSSANYARFIDLGNADASNNILFTRAGTTSNLQFEVYNGATGKAAVATGALINNEWHHYAVSQSPTGWATFYRDGQYVGRGYTNVPNNVTRTMNFMGRSNWVADAYYAGQMDDLRIYDRPLSQADIAGLAAGNQPATASGTITLNNTLTANGTLTLNGGLLDVSGTNYQINVGQSWINNGGRLSARQGTVLLYSGTGNYEILSGGQKLNDLQIDGSGTWNTRDRLTMSGALTLSSGTLDASGSYVIRTGTWTENGGSFTPRSGTVVLTSTADSTFIPMSDFGTLRIEDPTENGLIGYWKLDDGNGSVIRDSSPNGYHGTRTGTGSVWSGSSLPSLNFDNASAMRFNGSNDSVSVTHTSALTPSAITVAAWINPASLPGTNRTFAIVDKRDDVGGTAGYLLELAHSSGVQFVAWYSAGVYNAYQTDLPTNSWTHVALTQEGTNSVLYLNGVAVSSATNTTALTDYATPLRIGSGNGYFNGRIDDVRLYSRALNATEVKNLSRGAYANGANGTATVTLQGQPTVGTLKLDSGNLSADAYSLTVTNELQLLGGNGTFTQGAGGLTLNGGLLLSGATLTASTGTMDVNGDVRILTGSLTAPSGTFSVSGDWLKSGGIFTANGGTVRLDGTNQVMTGSTTFYNLRKTTLSADTLMIASGTTLTVTNTLTMNGAASNLLSLRSGTSGNQWLIDPQGTRTLSYLDVKDSRNLNATAIECLTTTSFCTDSGNNTNWTFSASSASSSSSSSSSVATDNSGGGGHRGRAGIGGEGAIADEARKSIAARFASKLQEGSASTQTTVAQRSSSSQSSRTITHASSSSRNIAQIAERHGLLVVTKENEPVVYKDVIVASWYAPYVSSVIEDGIAEGYKDVNGKLTGEFGVDKPVTRAELLKMALEAADITVDPKLPPPRNLTAQGSWAAPYIRYAENDQLTVFPVGTDVHAPASRGQVIQTILEVFGIPVGTKPGDYTDLPPNHPFAAALGTATYYGMLDGDTDENGNPTGTVRPNDNVNRAEVAKLIALARELLRE